MIQNIYIWNQKNISDRSKLWITELPNHRIIKW